MVSTTPLGWRLAVVIISKRFLGDVVNCIRGDWLRGGTGVIIAGALLIISFAAEN